MPLRGKPIDSITMADLESLVIDQVIESKQIEYKQTLPGRGDPEGKEFLKDVSSFANAAGGDLIFGIREEDGTPSEICGLHVQNIDDEKLRIENMIRDGIEPRIPGISIREITEQGKIVIIVRIPRSWALPHVVKYKGHWRFYSRNSSGAYPLDVSELRASFLLSESMGERIRRFRSERLSMIVSGEGTLAMSDSPKLVLHVIPISVVDPATRFDLSSAIALSERAPQIDRESHTWRYNFDGFVTYAPKGGSYVQIFHNGSIEAVNTSLFANPPYIPSTKFEQVLVKAVEMYVALIKELGVQPPIFIMLSLLGVKSFVVTGSQRTYGEVIERNDLVISEVTMNSFESHVAEILKPSFDAVWNAGGWPGSENYDREGKWQFGK
jgi:hypothetical protein